MELGKAAEKKIREWLDRPEDGYCFDRIPDQMTGFYGSNNICDFVLYKKPNIYYLESKATWTDRFDFSMITDHQKDGMMQKSKIDGVFSYVIVLFATYHRAFMLDINDILQQESQGRKSLNILKIDKWTIPYREISTIPNKRKELWDYNKEDNIL